MRRLRLFGFFLVFTLLCVSPASRASTFTSAIKEYTLKNGLKVLVIEDHKAPLATFQIWYRVGSVNEPAGKTGMSHLLEHMMFKGTHKYGSKQFSNIIQRNGGTDNAFTTKEYTMYFQTLSADRINLSIEMEADRMANLLLDPKELESEKNVVMEERRMRYEDDPQNALYEDVVAAAFKEHPYHWPVIGWMSDIASIGRNTLYQYYRSYYSPDNAFIVISGDVDPEAVIAKVKEEFGSIAPVSNRTAIKPDEPVQKGERRVSLKKEAELPYLIVSYHTPSFPHEDNYALDVLSTILSDGRSSRLYRSIVYGKRLALNAAADYSGFYRTPFLFSFSATAAPGKHIEDVEKAIYDEIDGIKKDPPSEKEVQRAKNQIESAFVFAQDSNYSKALYAGMFEIMGGWRLMDTYLEGIRKVTPADVQAVAKKYLKEENKTVGILIPQRPGGGK
ncbi:MAG TPA: pitrilysin family protein [Dissulfurispiraceae bacterium]